VEYPLFGSYPRQGHAVQIFSSAIRRVGLKLRRLFDAVAHDAVGP